MYGVTEVLVNPVQPIAGSLENPNVSLRDAAAWHDVFGGGESTSGAQVSFESVLGYPPMYRAITLIADKLAGTPIDVIDRETRETDRNHYAFKRLGKYQRTNPWTLSLNFKRAISIHAQTYGNGYAVIDRDGAGRPTQLVLQEPTNIHKALVEQPDGSFQLWWGSWDLKGNLVPVHNDDMFHLPNAATRDGIEGMSMLNLMRNALGLPLAAQEFSSRFFSNGANLSGILMIPGSLSDEKIRNTMRAWESMSSGLKRSHKVALIQDGVKYQPSMADPEKAQLTETMDRELRATVSNITGVPPHLLGDNSRAGYNGLEAENASLLNNCLRPHFDTFEAEANDKLRLEAEKNQDTVYIEFNVRDLRRMEFDKQAAAHASLVAVGATTTNDWLRSQNLPTIGEEGDKRYVPMNWQEVGADPVTPDPSAPETPPQAMQSLRALVTTSVTKSLQVERDRAVRASREAGNFLAWMDAFYPKWVSNTAGQLTDAARGPLEAYATESHSTLLNVTGSVTADGFEAKVISCVDGWDARRDQLVDDICKELE